MTWHYPEDTANCAGGEPIRLKLPGS